MPSRVHKRASKHTEHKEGTVLGSNRPSCGKQEHRSISTPYSTGSDKQALNARKITLEGSTENSTFQKTLSNLYMACIRALQQVACISERSGFRGNSVLLRFLQKLPLRTLRSGCMSVAECSTSHHYQPAARRRSQVLLLAAVALRDWLPFARVMTMNQWRVKQKKGKRRFLGT